MASLEMPSGRSKKDYSKEPQAVAEGEDGGTATVISATNGASDEPLEAVVAM